MTLESKREPQTLILVVDSLAAGGAERVASSLANHLMARNWRVVLITLNNPSSDFYRLENDVIRVDQRMVLPRWLAGKQASKVVRALRYAWMVLKLPRTAMGHKPDLIVSFITEMNVAVLLSLHRLGVPVLVGERNYPPLSKVGGVWSLGRRLLYARADVVTAMTTESASWLLSNTKARRVEVVQNPVTYPLPRTSDPTDTDKARSSLNGSRMLLAVGRLVNQKGFDRLLRAFAELVPSNSDWHLVILGEGPLRRELEEIVLQLHLENRVAFPGVVGNIGDWYESADLFAMTSRYEGFGNVLAEALAYGCPAVAVDCDAGPRDIVRHEVDGLLVPQDDHDALVHSLDFLMKNNEVRERFAVRAAEARERFSIDSITEIYERIFAEVISQSN